ncbi:MAG: transglutaminaseTgpA domain-containing protein, partial [Microthrixaceae bacterium]
MTSTVTPLTQPSESSEGPGSLTQKERSGPRGIMGADFAAEFGLLALALGTTLSFIRLFDSWGFFSELAIPVLSAWLIALTLRRLQVGIVASLSAQLLAGIFLLTAVFAPGSSKYLLPTPSTVRLLSKNISDSFADFSQAVAPVPATPGFLFVIAAVLWLFVIFGDAAAFRFEGPVQAAVPFVSSFLALGLLSRESARGGSTVCFIAGLFVYVVTQICLRTARTRWDGSPHRSATAVVARSAVLVGGLSLLGGVLLGPLLPGSTDPVVDLRKLGRGSEPRTVVSP